MRPTIEWRRTAAPAPHARLLVGTWRCLPISSLPVGRSPFTFALAESMRTTDHANRGLSRRLVLLAAVFACAAVITISFKVFQSSRHTVKANSNLVDKLRSAKHVRSAHPAPKQSLF